MKDSVSDSAWLDRWGSFSATEPQERSTGKVAVSVTVAGGEAGCDELSRGRAGDAVFTGAWLDRWRKREPRERSTGRVAASESVAGRATSYASVTVVSESRVEDRSCCAGGLVGASNLAFDEITVQLVGQLYMPEFRTGRSGGVVGVTRRAEAVGFCV